MEKIASFKVNHLRLERGVYVSRVDIVGNSKITTFDIRMTKPNFEPVMNTAEIHTIEHLGATFLRNHKDLRDKIIYFGPMGCRTGFYLVVAGEYSSQDILPLIILLFEFISSYEGDISGASAKDCGNHLDMNLPMAKFIAFKYLHETLYDMKPENLNYPNE